MMHVIIGTGAAGIAAAKTIRNLSASDEIFIISSDEAPYSRCMLHKHVSGERDLAGIGFIPEDFFDKNKITHLPCKRVTSVDTNAKKIILDDGEMSYDKLLIATGSNAAIPPIGQLREARNVFCLRHFGDAEGIKKLAETAENVLVIGGGLVGLDAAYALIEIGKNVTVVEMAETILAVNLDKTAAKAYQDKFEEAGCKFYLSARAADTVLDDQGNMTQLKLADGTLISCDLVVVAAGVRPAAEFLEGSGIKIDRCIKVDSAMKTSADDVYTAGDVAGLSGIWPNAVSQGEVAAKNMCGDKAEYTDTFAIKNTINFFSLASLALGKFQPEEGDEVCIREDRNVYQKVVMRDGLIKGVILQGDISNSGFWLYLIKNQIDISGLGKSVWELSFADFYGIDNCGEYQWAIAE